MLEKRRTKRKKLKIATRINGYKAEIIDISKTGLRFSSANLPPTNDISIVLKIGKKTIALKGFTHWIEKKQSIEGTYYELGVSVTNAPTEYFNHLEKLFPLKKKPKT